MRRADLGLLIWTAAATLLVDLTVAIATGVAMGLAIRLYRRDAPSDWTPPDR
jgi:SulP family sulfate permease